MEKLYSASLDVLHEMLEFVRVNAIRAGFEEIEVVKIELAVEETVVNIINYAYPNSRGALSLKCEIVENSSFSVTVTDKGPPYNPLSYFEPFDQNATLESRKVGGYGIFLILTLMDEVHYKRENDSNVLTLIRHLDAESQNSKL